MQHICFSLGITVFFGIAAVLCSAQDIDVFSSNDSPPAAPADFSAPSVVPAHAVAPPDLSANEPANAAGDVAAELAHAGDVTAKPAASKPAPTADSAVTQPHTITAKQFTGGAGRRSPLRERPAPALSEVAPPVAARSEPAFATQPITSAVPAAATRIDAPKELAANPLASQPADHPLAKYLRMPSESLSRITGKALSVEDLLKGARAAAARQQLLQAYWELSGRLAAYHIQRDHNLPATRIAELEFIKAQWNLAEQLKRHKSIDCTEKDLPIPTDYPLYQRYETYADKIARTERTEHLSHLIPIQEQLIEAKMQTQRIDDLLDLTTTIVEYNKMIAEYASATVASSISNEALVGAVIKLVKRGKPQTQFIQQTSYTPDN
ncbi:MAG: hypothetical protein LBT89_03570 [Planctomycetaceae bacterium]|jgi:hypothetical protein|nr:hypothetical protein [Planctomycetaceae bacterium]